MSIPLSHEVIIAGFAAVEQNSYKFNNNNVETSLIHNDINGVNEKNSYRIAELFVVSAFDNGYIAGQETPIGNGNQKIKTTVITEKGQNYRDKIKREFVKIDQMS
jgi:hypothetical protein